jgi:hypothetical protein
MSHDARRQAPPPTDMVRAGIERVLRPGCFFVAAPEAFRIQPLEETIPWEIFRGHLFDAAAARGTETFAAWHVFVDAPPTDGSPGSAPLVSVRWQPQRAVLYVTRQILTYGFEAYEDTPGVILSRPVQKWATELVGTIELGAVDASSLASEVGTLVRLAIVGTSRLPTASLETPLPAYSLGRLAYLPGLSAAEHPCTDALDFLRAALSQHRPLAEQAAALETALRVEAVGLAALADRLLAAASSTRQGAFRPHELLRAVFHGVALAPYTNFGRRLTELVARLSAADAFGPARALDVLGYMLRHLCRHLTAFDLTVFHNFGAN